MVFVVGFTVVTIAPCEGIASYQTNVPVPVPFNEANVTLCPAQIAGGVLMVKLIVGSWILNGTTAEQPTLSVIVTV